MSTVKPWAESVSRIVSLWVSEMTTGSLEHRRDAVHDPALAEEVIGDEPAAGLQDATHVLEGFLGKEKAFQPDAADTAVQDQRVDEGVDDQIVFLVGLAKEVPAVVQVQVDARVLVGAGRVMSHADPRDHGVDFDRVDMGTPPASRSSR
jgi:hypothetical protein